MCCQTLHRNDLKAFEMIWTYSNKVMLGQGNLDATTADDNDTVTTADESNPYMSPFQATQKVYIQKKSTCLPKNLWLYNGKKNNFLIMDLM